MNAGKEGKKREKRKKRFFVRGMGVGGGKRKAVALFWPPGKREVGAGREGGGEKGRNGSAAVRKTEKDMLSKRGVRGRGGKAFSLSFLGEGGKWRDHC